MKKLSLALLFLIFVIQADAQKGFEKFLQGFKVAKSFDTEDDAAEAANLSLTMPHDSASSYLIDLAVKHSLFNNFSATAELHRNTLLADQQRNYSLGINGVWGTNPDFNTTGAHTGWITANAQYSRDDIAGTGSLVADFNITELVSPGMVSGHLVPNHYNELGKDFALIYQPSLGVQYQNTFKAPNDSLKGNIIRPYFIFNVQLYPLRRAFNSNLDLFSNLTYRYDAIRTVKESDSRSHPLWSAGTEYLIWKALNPNKTVTKAVKLSLSYNTGDDPANGLQKQQYWLLALKLKI